MNRRDFLKNTALVSAAMMLPRFLTASSRLKFGGFAGKRLIVIQFSGGNDGLNTVIPYQNDIYYNLRPKLGIPMAECLKLDNHQGLNPSLLGLKELFDNGDVTVLNSVGYPNPNRSHFRSMDIWQSGSSADKYWNSGWIGRMLDAQFPDCAPYGAIEVDDTLSLALKGQQINGLAVQRPQQFYKNTHEPFFLSIAQDGHDSLHDHPEVDYLHKTLTETVNSAEYLHEKAKIYKSQLEYPATQLGRKLKQIAELIISGCETMVYYVSLSGFDTHINQKGAQGRLLQQYGDAVAALVKDLKQNRQFDNTMIMTFSEFGRRVKQNASGGTDHGTANNLFLISGGLKKPGIFNAAPNLSDLDEGDLKYEIDFRRIYATLLNKWLGADAGEVLAGEFQPLNLV